MSFLQSIRVGNWLGDAVSNAHLHGGPFRVVASSFLLTLIQLAPGLYAIWLAYDNLPHVLRWLGTDLATIGGWLSNWSAFVAQLI